MEDALFEVPMYRELVDISGTERVPDRFSALRTRHLREEHQISIQMLPAVNAKLADKRLMLKSGTVGDARLIAAPSSTKNSSGKRDPEIHQTKKGNQWHQAVKGTAANFNDVTQV